MAKSFLYHQIAESIRQEILHETLHPGDRLPAVREMAVRWACTIGTVQRAYEELTRQGLVVSRSGQGTRVIATIPAKEDLLLRQATLIHQAEAFLLEALTLGYSPTEAEQAVRIALDRWRTLNETSSTVGPKAPLRFVGSHDPAVTLIAAHTADNAPQFTFAGSLGGLMALARGEADLAGSHLWDAASDTYNMPFVMRLLPGRRVALLTLAHRRLGLMLSADCSAEINRLEDLAQTDLRFINRQRGAGTRVWLDAHLHQLGVAPECIPGYEQEMRTHWEVAQLIAEGKADIGLGIETVALTYGLHFIPLTLERYDLVIPAEIWDTPTIQILAQWLASEPARTEVLALGGYDVREMGRVEWVE